jgi:hypothetical protein
MTQPTGDEIRVATDTIRGEAAIWDECSATLATARESTWVMPIDGVPAGSIFAEFIASYNEVVALAHDRFRQGDAHTADVGTALRTVADTYDAEEQANLHALHNLY